MRFYVKVELIIWHVVLRNKKLGEVGRINQEVFHVIDLVMQAVYLPAHLWFILRLIKWRTPSPVSRWFIVLVFGLWGIVLGDFTETILSLFWKNNAIYAFGVYYQLTSTMLATMAFLIWNLYVAGNVRVVENRAFRTCVYALSLAVAVIICTDPLHHLFYEKLILDEPVIHGKVFAPCVLIVYGMLLAGWIISLVHIVKFGEDKLKRILVFSMYPLLPGITNLIRSLTGFTLIDLNPLVMTICIACLYFMVFKNHYVSILPASMEQTLEQTGNILFTYSPEKGTIGYSNRAAKERYSQAISEIVSKLDKDSRQFAGKYDGKYLKGSVSMVENELLVTATDVSEIKKQQESLLFQIRESTELLKELEEKKRNIDAYLDFLYEIPNLKEKWERFSAAQEQSKEAFTKMEENLRRTLEQGTDPKDLLNENLLISEKTIRSIREAVALLKEDAR